MVNDFDLSQFEVSTRTGFAYEHRVSALPARLALEDLNKLAQDLPKLSASGCKSSLKHRIDALERLQLNNLLGEQDRAVKRLGYSQIGHIAAAFLNHVDAVTNKSEKRMLPNVLTVPLFSLARDLDHPAGLWHSYMVLSNWTSPEDQHDKEYSLTVGEGSTPKLDDIGILVKIIDQIDYTWFFTVPARIEMDAGPGIAAGVRAIGACDQGDTVALCRELSVIQRSLLTMKDTLLKMYINCRPNTFYHGFRQYLKPLWPFETEDGRRICELFSDEDTANLLPTFGATAAQSSTLPFFDRLFGISPPNCEVKCFLDDMLSHMPKQHRQFLSLVRKRSHLGQYVRENFSEAINSAGSTDSGLVHEYNGCVEAIAEFRRVHLGIIQRYIIEPSIGGGAKAGSGQIGTGGSHLQDFLQTLLQSTTDQIVR